MNTSRLEQLLHFLEEEPNDPFILYGIANEYLKVDEAKALEYFNKLLSDHEDYVGTYYHAGKLNEKMGRQSIAENIYKKGMEVALRNKKMHALSELRGAYNSLLGLDFEND